MHIWKRLKIIGSSSFSQKDNLNIEEAANFLVTQIMASEHALLRRAAATDTVTPQLDRRRRSDGCAGCLKWTEASLKKKLYFAHFSVSNPLLKNYLFAIFWQLAEWSSYLFSLLSFNSPIRGHISSYFTHAQLYLYIYQVLIIFGPV